MSEQQVSPQVGITYDGYTNQHGDLIQYKIDQLRKNGIEFELNYKVAFTTWMEIRRARGAIVQSISNQSDLEKSPITDKLDKKLTDDEIDRLCHLTSLASLSCGVLFWTRGLTKENKLLESHTAVLKKMRNLTGKIMDPDAYSRYGTAIVMSTFNTFLMSYFENGVPSSDNLGEHFRQGEKRDFMGSKPHILLDTISVSALKNKTADGNTIVVLAAAASSGVLEAGIFAHYMNTQLGIPTTVDPVFFAKGDKGAPTRIISSVLPHQNILVIPLDDRVLGTGYSPRQAREAAREKYGSSRLVMSPKMQKV